MVASMLSSPRASQNLPTPKCSTCNQFVPLDQLGDHICAPTSRHPTTSPSPLATSNVPSHPGPSKLSMLTRDDPRISPRPHTPSNQSNPRLSPTTPRPSLYPQNTQQSSNLNPIRNIPPSNRGQPPPPLASHRGPSPAPSIPRSGTPANNNIHPTPNMVPPRDTGPPTPKNTVDFPRTITPDVRFQQVHSPRQSFVPPPERGIDTKTGGEAGMAGVGRRGFAAVARAAMFALPPKPLASQAPRKHNQPNYLDLDAVSHPTETPPLSAGSGYSSHSPGPISPLPQSEFSLQPTATNITRTPSPPDRSLSTPTQLESLKLPSSDPIPSLASPISTRLPFFEKFKNTFPGNNGTSHSANVASNDSSLNSTPTSASVARNNTLDSITSGLRYRSTTSSTTSSRHIKDVRRPISPLDSESEYGGLAYADSTDYEDDDGRSHRRDASHPDMPSLILRTGSSSSARRRHPSGSEQSENNGDRTGILIGSTRPRLDHSRTPSLSSISSAGGTGSLAKGRVSPAMIAQALGLSRTPVSDYGKLGGPGLGRSMSRRDAGPDSMEEMEKALEEAKIKTRSKQTSSGSSSQRSHLYRADTTSTLSRKNDDVINPGGSLKAHRSNTIQSPRPTSPESKPVKLPMRALTSPKLERDKALDGTGVRKERTRKVKVCLKCQKVIDNGRWVSVDGGGVLCERCWKNMYLPKCRRCNLSIEKQAVSSSDGQLKGKYHKECFNCDTCNKPFPDKTFYVYDGKPLCAYHYHEANDSLCAAARCGQPIEGPCAVSHSGDRYHPEHMTCEHPGYPSCKQMLSEYWEIDGRMLCERHANSASARGSDDEDDDEGWAKSKRRVTRFIDLAGGGGFGDATDGGLL